MFHPVIHYTLVHILQQNRPQAFAQIFGNREYPELGGIVRFFTVPYGGILVEAEVYGLPDARNGGRDAFFGFHIHENGDCSDSFQNTGDHYNPSGAGHPFHAGDMPPLMSNGGYAWTAFYDDRITISEILKKSVVIHRMPDDFTSQPSGDAGEKIGCGVIHSVRF